MPFEKNFQRLSFSSNIIKIPEPSKRRSIEKTERKKLEKREKKKEKEKLQEYLHIKRGSQYFKRRKTLQLQNPFCMGPFSSPPSYHFKNPFQNNLRKFHSSF
jgi:hypothetical protein